MRPPFRAEEAVVSGAAEALVAQQHARSGIKPAARETAPLVRTLGTASGQPASGSDRGQGWPKALDGAESGARLVQPKAKLKNGIGCAGGRRHGNSRSARYSADRCAAPAGGDNGWPGGRPMG
jgi:hypothetical protein